MAAEVAFDVVDDRDLIALADFNRDGPGELADERVLGLDPAVQDADADAVPGRAAPRPLTRDAAGPLRREREGFGGAGGEAPGRERALWCWLGHRSMLRLDGSDGSAGGVRRRIRRRF